MLQSTMYDRVVTTRNAKRSTCRHWTSGLLHEAKVEGNAMSGADLRGALLGLQDEMHRLFEQVDRRFEQVDRRFEMVDRQFRND